MYWLSFCLTGSKTTTKCNTQRECGVCDCVCSSNLDGETSSSMDDRVSMSGYKKYLTGFREPPSTAYWYHTSLNFFLALASIFYRSISIHFATEQYKWTWTWPSANKGKKISIAFCHVPSKYRLVRRFHSYNTSYTLWLILKQINITKN